MIFCFFSSSSLLPLSVFLLSSSAVRFFIAYILLICEERNEVMKFYNFYCESNTDGFNLIVVESIEWSVHEDFIIWIENNDNFFRRFENEEN